jgi:uncharacterized protein (TIGR03663 family)
MADVRTSVMDSAAPGAQERPFLTLHISAEAVAYLLLIAIGGAMRFWDLGSRAMHHDESLHAYFSWLFYDGRGYQHNPLMHGPFQFHGTALIYFLFGDSDYTARVLPAMFGTALIGLPYFLRGHLGRWGALVATAFLAFSPLLLYFSRFARNDIYIAFWTLLMVVLMWRYISERKNAYLYGLAAVLALAFATKETVFLIVAIFGSFWFIVWAEELVRRWLGSRRERLASEGQEALGRPHFRLSLPGLSAPGVLFLMLFTLTLPQWAALLSIIQDWFGLTLANPADNWQFGPVGAPVGDGAFVVATITVLLLFAVSALLGVMWNLRVWLIAALIFYGVFVLLYSTVFTHLAGVGSGMWQSLGYWLAQHDVRRGDQPSYYYLVIVPLYEFLPLTFAFLGLLYYAFRRAELFTWFLIYWTVMAFVGFSLAGEKMPWLSLNMALPVILLGARFLGQVVERIPWQAVWRNKGWLLVLLVPLLLMVLNGVIGWGSGDEGKLGNAGRFLLILLAGGTVAALWFLGSRLGRSVALPILAVAIVPVLALFTVRSGWVATYRNGDVPKEILVYTQTSPDIPQIRDEINRIATMTGQGTSLKIYIDPHSGFQWPWAWYLRDYTNVSYPAFPLRSEPDAAVVIAHANNRGITEQVMGNYSPGIQVRLRWWFPESYRGLTPKKLAQGVVDRDFWGEVWDYFTFRKLDQPLGSEDAVVYFKKDLF